jgi:hypothetical protein
VRSESMLANGHDDDQIPAAHKRGEALPDS